jgi:hypothetical protein
MIWYNDNLFTIPNLQFLKSESGRYFGAQKKKRLEIQTERERVGILRMPVLEFKN